MSSCRRAHRPGYLYQQTGDDFAAELQRHKEVTVSDGDGEDDDADDPTETATEVAAVKEEDEITIELDTEDFPLLEPVMSVGQPKPPPPPPHTVSYKALLLN